MTILSPGDPLEVDLCMNYIFKDKSPKYLRLHKAGERTVTKNKEPLCGGIWRKLTNENSNNIFLSTGNGLDIAIKMKNFDKYNNYDIYTCPIWGSKFIKSQLIQSNKFNKIITVEDHLFACGFGSWIQESLHKNKLLELDFISLDENIIGKVGCEDYLLNFLKKPDI
jgi:transketolase C-terminal domain/subunit